MSLDVYKGYSSFVFHEGRGCVFSWFNPWLQRMCLRFVGLRQRREPAESHSCLQMDHTGGSCKNVHVEVEAYHSFNLNGKKKAADKQP